MGIVTKKIRQVSLTTIMGTLRARMISMGFTLHLTNLNQVKNKHMAQNNPKARSIQKQTFMAHTLLINLSQMKTQSITNNNPNLSKITNNSTISTPSNSMITIHTIDHRTLMNNLLLQKKKTVSTNFMKRMLTLIKTLKVTGTPLKNKGTKFNQMKKDDMKELRNMDSMILLKTQIFIKRIEVMPKKTFLKVGARISEVSIIRCLISKTLIKSLDKLTTLMLNSRMRKSGLIPRLMNQ